MTTIAYLREMSRIPKLLHRVHTRQRSGRPQRGDAVWVEERWHERKQPNGFIIMVLWEDEDVVVKYFDGDDDTFSFYDLEGNWTDRMGGV